MGRVLILFACNVAYWHYDDGTWVRILNWNTCPAPAPVQKAEPVTVRPRRRPAPEPDLNDLVYTTRRRK